MGGVEPSSSAPVEHCTALSNERRQDLRLAPKRFIRIILPRSMFVLPEPVMISCADSGFTGFGTDLPLWLRAESLLFSGVAM